jgi:hypothetical protein
MATARQLRHWISWLFLLGAASAAVISANYIPQIIHAFGPDYPRTDTPDLPAFSALFLSHSGLIGPSMYLLVVGEIFGAIVVVRSAVSWESRIHWISLVSLLVYHLVLMTWIAFVLAFFWLPHLKAGI